MAVHILVTGGAGNLGSALVHGLVSDENTHVLVADDFSTGRPANIPDGERVKYVRCDVNDYDDISGVFLRRSFEYVFHYAAVVGVKRTLTSPLLVIRDIKGIENVLKLGKNTGVRRIFFSSSSEVYGEPVDFPQNEHTTPLNSRLPYAIVKNLAEAYLRSYQQEYGLDYTIFRFFNTYGPNQTEDFVVPRFVRRALRGEDIVVYGDGSQARTFCYVDDSVDACLATFKQQEFVNDVINIGSDVEVTILELAQMVLEIVGGRSRIVHAPALKEGDMARRLPDNARMRSLLGRPLVTLQEGITRLLEHHRS